MEIKICGITRVDDAVCAVSCGANMLGFIFYPPSPRYITPAAARAITSQITGLELVGVFVDETPESMLAIADEAGLTALQLHGNEPAACVSRLEGYRIIKALSISTEAELAKLDDYPDVDILIDTPCPEHGGMGETGDWDLARSAAERRPIILAGGLNPSNVVHASQYVNPAGLDVSTGVEKAKGVKDHEKIRAFFEAIRGAKEY